MKPGRRLERGTLAGGLRKPRPVGFTRAESGGGGGVALHVEGVVGGGDELAERVRARGRFMEDSGDPALLASLGAPLHPHPHHPDPHGADQVPPLLLLLAFPHPLLPRSPSLSRPSNPCSPSPPATEPLHPSDHHSADQSTAPPLPYHPSRHLRVPLSAVCVRAFARM